MIDDKKIADLRVLLVKSRALPFRRDLADELQDALDSCAGELLALADAAIKLRALFPNEPWPQWMPEDKAGVVLVRCRNIMRDLESLEGAARKTPGRGGQAGGEEAGSVRPREARPEWTQPDASLLLWGASAATILLWGTGPWEAGAYTDEAMVEAWRAFYPGRELLREMEGCAEGGTVYRRLQEGLVFVSRPASEGGSQIRLLFSEVCNLLSKSKVEADEPEWDDYDNLVTAWSEDDADVGCSGHEGLTGALERLFYDVLPTRVVATEEDADVVLKLTACGLVIAESYPGNSEIKILRRSLGIAPPVGRGGS